MQYNGEIATVFCMFLTPLLFIDLTVHTWFNSVHTDSLTTFFSFVTVFGNWWFVIPLAVFVCIFLYRTEQRRLVVAFVSTLVSAEIVTYVIKILVARPRALDALVIENDFSFPSGHSMVAVALYGFLMYVSSRFIQRVWVRRLVILTLGLLIALIGLSRLYLGVHYLSDVLAGYLIGGAALLVCIRLLPPRRERVQ